MPMKIFLSEIIKDKYRNKIIIKFWIFLPSHMVKATLEDWPTSKLCISVISGEDLPQFIRKGFLNKLCVFLGLYTSALFALMLFLMVLLQHTNYTTSTVYAKTAGLSDKTGKFSFYPAESCYLSDKCPTSLRKCQQTCFVTFKQEVLISWLKGTSH